MPKSVAISIVAAIIGCAIFALLNGEVEPRPNRQDYINVALNFFTVTAIICLFVIFYRYEKADDAAFGSVVRNNISTIIIALLIQFIGTIIDIVTRFSP